MNRAWTIGSLLLVVLLGIAIPIAYQRGARAERIRVEFDERARGACMQADFLALLRRQPQVNASDVERTEARLEELLVSIAGWRQGRDLSSEATRLLEFVERYRHHFPYEVASGGELWVRPHAYTPDVHLEVTGLFDLLPDPGQFRIRNLDNRILGNDEESETTKSPNKPPGHVPSKAAADGGL